MYANGTLAPGLPVTRQWQKSSYSIQGNCVQTNRLTDGSVAVRNSSDPTGPALVFTTDEWDAFIKGAKAGEFDLA